MSGEEHKALVDVSFFHKLAQAGGCPSCQKISLIFDAGEYDARLYCTLCQFSMEDILILDGYRRGI